jgi:hypothetical protein
MRFYCTDFHSVFEEIFIWNSSSSPVLLKTLIFLFLSKKANRIRQKRIRYIFEIVSGGILATHAMAVWFPRCGFFSLYLIDLLSYRHQLYLLPYLFGTFTKYCTVFTNISLIVSGVWNKNNEEGQTFVALLFHPLPDIGDLHSPFSILVFLLSVQREEVFPANIFASRGSGDGTIFNKRKNSAVFETHCCAVDFCY